MTNEPGLFETIFGTRAMRRLKPDPVPDELIVRILRAGQAAPNGSNAQNWGFLVVKDPAVKAKVAGYYRRAWDEGPRQHYEARFAAMPEGSGKDRLARQQDAVHYLSDHFHEAPVWIVPCLKVGEQGANVLSGASIYPAVQNMLLAARVFALGAVLTARHLMFIEAVDAIFGLPEGFRSFAIVPVGYPMGKFGPVGRGDLADFVHLDRWGERYL